MGKIILLGPYPPPYGGVSMYVFSLHLFLVQKGFDCELKVIRQHSNSDKDVLPKFRSVYRHFQNLAQSDTCVDSGTLYLEYRSGMAPFAWVLLKFLKGFRWIKIIHDGSLPLRYEKYGFARKLWIRYLMGRVDAFIVVSEDLFKWLKDTIRVKQDVHLIKSLLPIPDHQADISLSGEVKKAITGHSKLVCSVGAFTAEYGFAHIAEAVEAIRRDLGEEVGLLLVDGGFILEDVEAYRASVVQNRAWITVLQGVPHPQMLQLFKRSDVFVRAVALESYGISRVESILCGTPVIATRVGETRGISLYNYGDIAALSEAIKEVLFGGVLQDVGFWGECFRQEAEANLNSVIKVIKKILERTCLSD